MGWGPTSALPFRIAGFRNPRQIISVCSTWPAPVTILNQRLPFGSDLPNWIANPVAARRGFSKPTLGESSAFNNSKNGCPRRRRSTASNNLLMQVPFLNPAAQYEALKNDLLPAVEGVLGSGRYILGPNVEAFE